MKPRNTVFFAVLASAFIILVFICLSFDKIAVAFFLHPRDLSVSYKKFTNKSFKELIFTDFSMLDKKRGIGFTAHTADISPHYNTLFSGATTVDFRFSDLRFIAKKGPGEVKASTDVNELVIMPFSGSSSYHDVYGTIQSRKDSLYIESLTADGQTICLSLKGSIYNDQTADLALTIRFAKDLLAGIPEDWSKVVLRDEPNDWKSISANITGDLSKPYLQVTGRLFRLNIREKK